MKRNRPWKQVLWLVLILSAFIFAALLVVQFKSVRDNGVKQPEEPEPTEASSSEETQTGTSEEQTSEQETEGERLEEQGYLIIGDSHAVVTDGMGYNVYGSRVEGVSPDRNLFIVHTGLDPVMGTLEWLEGDGAERMKEIIAEHTEIAQWNIISMHGTSMVTVANIEEQYIANYQKWMDESFSDCHVYIVSVPPLDEQEWVIQHPDLPARSNEDIIRFNNKIKNAFPDHFFDYYDWFLERSDSFQDEIHYTGETYCEMFDEIIGSIQQK
ncbi:MAG: hypothetical protein K2G51_00885 [Lachnospiraceae bacterium]|nr:hypothetical protein [Lachnospiraceae bacterium]MDE7274535.1 hypothetical protein [Lachnospiraceae bacterium]